MSNPFSQSMKDQMDKIDFFIDKIWNSFVDMLATMVEYVKYFLNIAFNSLKYIFILFGIIFILIILFSKEKKGNLYVLFYFLIGVTMFTSLGGAISVSIEAVQSFIKMIESFKASTDHDRPTSQRMNKVGEGFKQMFKFIGLLIALFFIFISLSILYTIEISLYDTINEMFRGKE